MYKNIIKKDQGFSLIELVLVLAVGALILGLVFLALSGAQKARRDTARKSDAARLLAAIEQCASNNNGAYGNCQTQAQLITAPNTYFAGNNPTGGAAYTIGAAAGLGVFAVGAGGCPGAPAGATASVTIAQEAGAPYCVDNH